MQRMDDVLMCVVCGFVFVVRCGQDRCTTHKTSKSNDGITMIGVAVWCLDDCDCVC